MPVTNCHQVHGTHAKPKQDTAANLAQPGEDISASSPLRRSSRRAAQPASISLHSTAALTRNDKAGAAKGEMAGQRRNPKRKASEPNNDVEVSSSDMLREALRPLEPKEIEEWEGWAELESEPAFFNTILRDLGVEGVKVQELFSVDQESVNLLRKPVFGLVFLFQYLPGMDEAESEDAPGTVWFANQTTHNACATVALLNIVMNAPEVELGSRLKEFKESTKDLSTPLRGYQLSSSTFIRSIHNSFTRRMDHLSADLSLENEASDSKKKRSKTSAGSRKGEGQRGKNLAPPDTAFHFIAYVPADGQVWELDGLKAKPRRIGPIDSEYWTAVARPQIQARMLQYEESQLSFNLLALCRSPLALYSSKIVEGLSFLQYLGEYLVSKMGSHGYQAKGNLTDLVNDQYLSEFQLTATHIENAEIPDTFRDAVSGSTLEDLPQLQSSLVIKTLAAMGEYRAEISSMAEDEARVKGRKKDYGPALHKWVTKLAEKDVLDGLIDNTG